MLSQISVTFDCWLFKYWYSLSKVKVLPGVEEEPNSSSTHRLGLRRGNRDKLGRRRLGSYINVCLYHWYRWVGRSVPCDCQSRTRCHRFFICLIFCCSLAVLEIKPGDKVLLFDFHTIDLGFWGRHQVFQSAVSIRLSLMFFLLCFHFFNCFMWPKDFWSIAVLTFCFGLNKFIIFFFLTRLYWFLLKLVTCTY